MLKQEILRLIRSLRFWLALLCGFILIFIQSFTIMKANANFINSAYLHLTGFDATGLGSRLYYLIIPLTAALAAGSSYEYDKNHNLTFAAITRIKLTKYLKAKLVSAFLVGGAVASLPLFSEGCYFFIRNSTKAMSANFELLPIAKNGWGFKLFISHPIIFWLITLLIVFLFAGLFAMLAVTASYFEIRSGVEVIIPFILTTITMILRDFLGQEWLSIPSIMTPTFSNDYSGTLVAIIGYLIILFLVVFGLTYRRVKQDD